MIQTVAERRTAVSRTALADLIERIGRDHALHADELGPLDGAAAGAAPRYWAAYAEHWSRWCGARLDPQFCRLAHPARWSGSVCVSDAAPVVIVGTGPSLKRRLPELKRVRQGVHLFTSPRGADALAEAGLAADLVLVEHPTALDAMFSVADLAHRRTTAMTRARFVAATPQTPAALLEGVSAHRLFVPDPLPTWGLWPATAAAIALGSGTPTVALLGVDLGTADCPDPAHAPLSALLGLLAAHADVDCVDAGAGGARKPGWPAQALDRFAGRASPRPISLDARPWLDPDERYEAAAAASRRIAPFTAEAGAVLAAAIRLRNGDRSPDAYEYLERGLERLLAIGGAPDVRHDIQDGLGVSYLPRYWRNPPDRTLEHQLWRPAALAAHELVRQHESLSRWLTLAKGTR